MLQYVHHVHYLVKNRDAMVEYLERNFGMKPKHLIDQGGKRRDMRDAIYQVGKTQIEITEPLNPESPMGQQLAKQGPGIWHVAWGVDNIQKLAKDLVAKGNKLRDIDKLTTDSIHGYVTINIDRASAHGLHFQLAEGVPVVKS